MAVTEWLSSSLICVMLLCQVPRFCASNQCLDIQVKNSIVDVKAALLKGVRSKDPVHVATPDACIKLCCDGEPVKEQKLCNLAIFAPKRNAKHPNCYMFYCPNEAACPLKHEEDFTSYWIKRDIDDLDRKHLNKDPLPKESDGNAHLTKDNVTLTQSNSQTSQHDAHKDVQKNITVHLLHIVNNLEKNLDKIEEKLKDDFSNTSENQNQVHHPTKAPARKKFNKTTVAPLIARVKSASVFSNKDSTTTGKTRTLKVQHAWTTAEPQTAISVTPAASSVAFTTAVKSQATSATSHQTAFMSTTSQKTVTRTSTSTTLTQAKAAKLPAAALAKSTNGVLILTKSTTTTPHQFKKTTSHLVAAGHGILSSKSTWNFTGTTRSSASAGKTTTTAHVSPLVDVKKLDLVINETITVKLIHMESPANIQKSLVATLLFGVLFLSLVLAIFGQRALDSFRRRHYTRFDYLINGMYIGI